MTSEVREAAGRLRRLSIYGGGESAWDVYSGSSQIVSRCISEDEHRVAKACLAMIDAADSLAKRLDALGDEQAEKIKILIEDDNVHLFRYRQGMRNAYRIAAREARKNIPLQPIGQEQGK